MTEAEKRAVGALRGVKFDCIITVDGVPHDTPLRFDESGAVRLLAGIRAAGLAIVERPQRKPLPDCEGCWWVKPHGELPMASMAFTMRGRLCVWGFDMSQIEWAEGPIEVPE